MPTVPNYPTLFDVVDTQPAVQPIEESYAPIVKRALPKRAARRKLVEQLVGVYKMQPRYAEAIARVVVDPELVRKRLATPTAHRLQDGVLHTIDAEVFTCGVLPYPANPRTSMGLRFAVSGTPPADTPTPPLVLDADQLNGVNQAALEIRVENEIRLKALTSSNTGTILAQNNLVSSVSHQGILNPVFGVTADVVLEDGTSGCVLIAADGSSRITAAHKILGLEAHRTIFPFAEEHPNGPVAFEQYVKNLLRENDQLTNLEIRTEPKAMLEARQRALTATMTLIVSWESLPGFNTSLLSLIRTKLGLIHVGGAKPWDLSSQRDAMADSVLDTLLRAGRIDDSQQRWMAGHMGPEESIRNGFVHLPDERFVELFGTLLRSNHTRLVNEGIRKMTPTGNLGSAERVAVGVELSMRPLRARGEYEADALSRIRATFVDVLNETLFVTPEPAAGRSHGNKRLADIKGNNESVEDLLVLALASGASGSESATRRLALLALWTLVTCGLLVRLDGRSVSNPARPRTILNNMTGSKQGLRILYQAIVDGRAAIAPRLVDESGKIITDEDGNDVVLTAELLREMFAVGQTQTAAEAELDRIALPADSLRQLTDLAMADITRAAVALEEALAIRDEEGKLIHELFGLELDKLAASAQTLHGVQINVTELMAASKRLKRVHQAAAEINDHAFTSLDTDGFDGHLSTEVE